jgi:hypothetical protein
VCVVQGREITDTATRFELYPDGAKLLVSAPSMPTIEEATPSD